jgi:D-alanyl-D-alanine carboxypeptidase
MNMGKTIGRLIAVAFGAVAGVLIVFAVEGLTSDGNKLDVPEVSDDLTETIQPEFEDGGPSNGNPKGKRRPEMKADVLLAWAPGSLPAGTEARIESMPEVKDATTVYAGLDWIQSARAADGSVVETHQEGWGVPFEIAAVEPREYARFVPPKDRATMRSLGDAGALLAETSTELREGGEGLQLQLESSSLKVTGVVSDLATNGYEALVSTPVPDHWERADRFVLAHLRSPKDRTTVAKEIKSLLPPSEPLRTRRQGENPFLRYGDAVLPQLLVKKTFGEFVARDVGDGTIEIGSGWLEENIRTDVVPILGEIQCHRLLFPQLKEALRDVRREGLSHAIHQDSGCFAPRFINSIPNGRLSHHSWGIAVDINQDENGFSDKPNMDMRVVEIFEDRWGFTWGGRWIIPDGMHFEWIKFP